MPNKAQISVGRSINEYAHTSDMIIPKFWSKAFQWLPCDVKFAGDDVKITSYINNLHPTMYSELYSVVEKLIGKSIPLWNLSLSSTHGKRKARIQHDYTDYDYPQGMNPPEDLLDVWADLEMWRATTRSLQRPEPREFESCQLPAITRVNLQTEFAEHGLQVIVKLANIELTPEKPIYGGGAWHVEGQLNERICATALYYYGTENVTENFLAFRHRTDDDGFESKSYDQVRSPIFNTTQHHGLCPESFYASFLVVVANCNRMTMRVLKNSTASNNMGPKCRKSAES